MLEITVDEQGFIRHGDEKLSQKDAIDLAAKLTRAVRASIDRNQIGTKHYNDTDNILARLDSPLGRATSALEKVFG